jgi:hypothetical protein
MRFELTQHFTSSATDVDEAYADADLYPTLVGLPKLGGIEVLAHQRDGQRARLAVRFRFTGQLSAAVTAVVDPERLSWVQQSDHDLATGITTFRLVPDHYPDRLSASGRVTIRPTGAGAQGAGAQRVITGELKVRALLVGGRVEHAIIEGLAEFLAAEAPAVDRYLTEPNGVSGDLLGRPPAGPTDRGTGPAASR